MTNGIKRSQLRSFQKWGIRQIYENEITILGWQMGAGKSVTVLTAADDLLEDGIVKKVLIVAPMLVATATYPDEFADWKHLNHIDWTLIRAEDDDEDIVRAYKDAYEIAKIAGLPAAEASKWAGRHRTRAKEWKRRRLVSDGAEVHIINKEGLPWLWKHFEKKWPYDMMIVDEASVFKNGKKRTATKEISIFGAAAKARKFVKRIVLMTGTPTPKGLRNMWGLAYIADLGERLGSSRTKFEERWFDKDYMGWNLTPKPHAQREITERMSDIMFTLDPELYPDLPPLLINDVRVTLPRKAMEEYQAFKKTLVSEAYDIEAVNRGVLAGKLLQFCIAEGTDVLTRDGWKPIESIGATDLIWDGEQFVAHGGLLYQGEKEVIPCFGVDMTKEHLILTVEGWKKAEEILDGASCERFDRHEVRLPDGFVETRVDGNFYEEGHLAVPLRLREGSSSDQSESSFATSTHSHSELRLQARENCEQRCKWSRYDWHQALPDLDAHEVSLPGSFGQGFQELWGSWDRHASSVVRIFRGVLGRCESWIRGQFVHRQGEQQRAVFGAELPMGDGETAVAEHPSQRACRESVGYDLSSGSSREGGFGISDFLQEVQEGPSRTEIVQTRRSKVYDIADCGPRNRYVVRGSRGPLIVHNCNGSMYDENGRDVWIHDKKLEALEEIVNEADGAPVLVAYNFKFDLDRIRKKFKKAVVFGEGDVRKTKADWNAGKIDLLLAHPQSVGHGQNIQFGGNILVWYGLTHDLETYQQMNKRLHRPGQTRPVTIRHIIAKGTYDDDILPKLQDRAITQDEIMADLRLKLLGRRKTSANHR